MLRTDYKYRSLTARKYQKEFAVLSRFSEIYIRSESPGENSCLYSKLDGSTNPFYWTFLNANIIIKWENSTRGDFLSKEQFELYI